MASAAINGVRLQLNIEVDDTELMEKADEIVDAIAELDDGASELNEGAEKLCDATGTLNDKVGELNDGVGELAEGAGDLHSGLSDITEKNSDLTSAAYTAYEGLCTAAAAALNAQLSVNDMDAVTLTPSNYSDVLTELTEKLDADAVYNQAYQTALQQVTKQVNAQADELYHGYAASEADSICLAYLTSRADELYAQAAAQAVYAQLLQSGYTEEHAATFLQTSEGQTAAAQAAANMTEEQKAQILSSAAAQLTDEQKTQILQGAVASLTEEQKTQIREAYIQQLMASDEVTAQISSAVSLADAAAAQISDLKTQLDNYGTFCQGLTDYTNAVSSAVSGAESLKSGMDTLCDGIETLKRSVGELSDAVKELYDGTQTLADGTSEFVSETADIGTQISDEITAMTSSITGGDAETVSFVSDKNTDVASVQFVIKTAAIEKPEAAVPETAEEEALDFRQKLLRLFGVD